LQQIFNFDVGGLSAFSAVVKISDVGLIRILVLSLCLVDAKEHLQGNDDGPNEAEASTAHFLLLCVICLHHGSADVTARVSASLSLEEPQGAKGDTHHCPHGSYLRCCVLCWFVRCQRK